VRSAVFGGVEEGFDLGHHVILKLGWQFVEEAYHPLKFLVRGLVKHTALAGFEPGFADPEGEGNEAEYPVVGVLVAAFQFGDVAVADENGPGELGLGELEGLADFSNPLVDGHEVKHSGKGLTGQGYLSAR
jgi:hypothetical protein